MEKDSLIGYGNWSRNTQMKFYEPTMNKGLRKLIHKRFDTITINGHNTSKNVLVVIKTCVIIKIKIKKKFFCLLKCSECASSSNKKKSYLEHEM